MLRISLPATSRAEMTVEIVDALGTVVSSTRGYGETTEVKAPSTAGVYAVKVTTEGKSTSCFKLVVK